MRARPSLYCLLNGKSLKRSKSFACKFFKGKFEVIDSLNPVIDSEILNGFRYVTALNKYALPYSPLPHELRTESGDVCLFTKDEPKMTSEQTQRFYKKLLTERGVKHVIEV